MSDLRKAAQQALEALESVDWYLNQLEEIVYSADDAGTHEERAKAQPAIAALRAALAQGCYIAQDMTRQEYERLYPDAEEEVK